MDKKDKINKFKPTPLQFLLLIAGIIWVIVLSGTVYNLPDIPKTTKDEIRRVIFKDTASVADLEFNKGKTTPGVLISSVLTPDDNLLAMGEASYKSSCASCHGDYGKGDGAAGTMLNPKPRNLQEKTGWKNGRDIAGMFKTLQEGIPGSGMSAYEFLPVEELFAIIYYIRSLTNDFPPVTEDEIKSIDNIYDITSDKKVGTSIPVKIAKTKIINDNKSNIEKLLTQIENTENPAIKLFDKITWDKRKALQTLVNSKAWQKDKNALIKIITANTANNGFKPNASMLSTEEFAQLQEFLNININY